MPQLASYPDPPAAPARHGFVAQAPGAAGDAFTVTIPDFDDQHVYEIRRWATRGGAIPAVGDEVLVVVDDQAEPWVTAWWPAVGSADSAKGVVIHGADPAVARPGGYPSVEWIGTVEPANALDNDTWVNPS